MTRFILLTFGLLGFVGYEMSGGADFQPRPRPEVVAKVTPPPPVTVNVPTTAATLVATRAMERRTAREARNDTPVIRTSLANGLTSFPTSGEAQAKIASLQEIADAASFETPSDSGNAPADQPGNVQAAAAQPAIIQPAAVQPEVIETAAVQIPADQTQEAVRPAPDANADMRAISATRVNLRSGPGIDSEVLARLTRGQMVQVLDNNGQGWLRLRTMPDDQVGWIAERLVGPAVN